MSDSDSDLDMESLFESPGEVATVPAPVVSTSQPQREVATTLTAATMRRPRLPVTTPATTPVTLRGGFTVEAPLPPPPTVVVAGPPANSVDERALVPCRSAVEDWEEVHQMLEEYRSVRRRMDALENEAFSRLDAYLERHGEEGRELAGTYRRLVQRTRQGRKAAEAEDKRWLAEDALLKAEKKAYDELMRLQREFTQRSAQLSAQVSSVQMARQRLAQKGPDPPAGQPKKVRNCFVCGWPNVVRGRECLNRANHPRK